MRSVLLLAAAVLASHVAATAAVAQSVELAPLQRELANLREIESELATAIQNATADNQRLAEEISDFDRDARTPVTLGELEQAQFAANIARTRVETVRRRVVGIEEQILELRSEIAQAAIRDQRTPNDTLAAIVEEEAQELRRLKLEVLEGVRERLVALQALVAERADLLSEELEITRSLIQLSAIEGLGTATRSALVSNLRNLIGDITRRNIALANAASEIEAVTPADALRRNLLNLRSDELLLVSSARQIDVDIASARSILSGLTVMRDADAVPLRLFNDGIERLENVRDTLRARQTEVAEIRRSAAGVEEIVRATLRAAPEGMVEGGAGAELVKRLDELGRLLDDQERDLGNLLARIEVILPDLAERAQRRLSESLAERQTVRLEAAARARLFEDARELPPRMLGVLARGWTEIRVKVASAPDLTKLGAIGLAVVIVLVVLGLRRRLASLYAGASRRRATEIPVEVVRRNLIWLLPAALFGVVVALFDLTRATATLGLTMLLTPAAAIFLRDFILVFGVERVSGSQKRIGRIMTRLTEVALVFITVFVIAFSIIDQLFVLPSTRLWIDRAVYFTFILGGLPLFLLAAFFNATGRRGSGTTLARLLAAGASLILPLLLISIGSIGLAGYTALASEVLGDALTLIAILVVMGIAVGIVKDILDEIVERIRNEDPARAYFVRSNFATPIYRVAQAIVAIAGVVAVIEIFNLTVDTPVIREVVAIFGARLFTLGGTTYTLGSLLLAGVAFAGVFWIGSWSRRVSYTIVFGRIKDIGIRSSLSVFAQYVVIVVGLLVTLSAIGFDVTTLTVFAASLGVGIGFGMQNVVNNFISGLLLLVERPLRLGDIVTVSGTTGTVEHIGIRSLRLKTFDEYDVIVPNSSVISDTFVNWSRTDTVIRQLITVGVRYGDDLALAVSLIDRILREYDPILSKPEHSVTVDEFADSSINIRVAYYVDLQGAVGIFAIRNHVLQEIWTAFTEAGITIPFPQRDLHVATAPGLEAFLRRAEGGGPDAPSGVPHGARPADLTGSREAGATGGVGAALGGGLSLVKADRAEAAGKRRPQEPVPGQGQHNDTGEFDE